jgi:para-nitrobenzyl esterase
MRPSAWLIATCIAVLASPLARADSDHSKLQRQTQYGPVLGVDDSALSGAFSWKGVPFAKPPVGELRWKAPQELEKWKAPRATQQFGNACVQYGRIYGPGANNRYDQTIGTTLGQAVGSEDCLYLNIWRPATNHGGLPVIVFVHGGSNVSGYTADPVYDGAALAKAANAVVVTVNYRLGIFGFLSVAQLKTGADAQEDSGNFALLDIIKALQFVNRNISNFGGNPSKVTLMGQSAGAVNVYALLTTPATVDARPRLFDRVVPLSRSPATCRRGVCRP